MLWNLVSLSIFLSHYFILFKKFITLFVQFKFFDIIFFLYANVNALLFTGIGMKFSLFVSISLPLFFIVQKIYHALCLVLIFWYHFFFLCANVNALLFTGIVLGTHEISLVYNSNIINSRSLADSKRFHILPFFITFTNPKSKQNNILAKLLLLLLCLLCLYSIATLIDFF